MGNFKSELHNFQNVPRELVFDKTLSDRARFVYIFMACKPEGWEFYLEPMAKDIGYSIETLRKYINELVASGWLVKGVQQTADSGKFGAVEYMLLASKISDTEKVRHGISPLQDNIDNKKIEINNKKENLSKESQNAKNELFEKCYVAYRRKCESKKRAKEYWDKLTPEERNMVLPHVKAYVSTRELQYQKSFDRYLRDKVFTTNVISGNTIVYDPSKINGSETAYLPICGGALMWNDYYKTYLFTGYWDGKTISDGYDDDTRPDGASVTLNNGRGTLVWNSETKTWNKI